MDGDNTVALAAQHTLRTLIPVFECLPFGVLFLDAHGKVTLANQAAHRTLRSCTSLRLRHETLTATAPRDSSRMRQFLSRAVALTQAGPPLCTGILLESASLAVEIVAMPLVSTPSNVTANDAAAVLLLFDGGSNSSINPNALSQLYGLTRSESLLAGHVVNGMSVDAIARKLDISVLTARTHLKRVLVKTGCRRQSELVHRIEMGPAALNLEVEWI